MARRLANGGHEVSVYTWSDRPADEDRGVRIVATPRRGMIRGPFEMRRRLARDLSAGALDIVEAPESSAHVLPGGFGTVVRMHGSHHFWCKTLDQRVKPMRIVLEQVGIRSAHGLCAVSRFAAELTRDVMRLGRRDIDVLYNPIDTEMFQPRPESVVRNRIVFAGSITEKKGVRELCQSLSRVRRVIPDAELHIAGRDQPGTRGHPSFRKQILESLDGPTRERVRFLGPLPLEDTAALMATAAVCAFPSYMETMGMVIAEAMACGRPVVTTVRGPGPEVLGAEGGCGYLAEPTSPEDIADKMVRVLSEPEKAEEMGRRGRRRAEELFSAKGCLARNVEFYERHAYRA